MIIPESSVQYWNLIFAPPPAAKHAFQRSSDQWVDCGNGFWRFSFILQKWTAPSSSRCTFCEWRRRWITFFEISYAETECSPGSISFHCLLSIAIILDDDSAGSLLCGFCFCLWSACKIFRIQLWRIFFELIFRNFCVVVIRFHHNYIWSMGNSDRVSIVSAQRHNSDLNSMFTVQVTDFQQGSIFCVSLDPSFRLWCWIFSWKGVFTTSHCVELCHIASVFRHGILFILTSLRNPASIQNLLNLSCCDSFSIRSSFYWNRKFWYAIMETSVFIALSTIDCPITSSSPDLSWRVSYSHISATAP